MVDAIIAGVPADQVKDKMIALDERRKDLEAQLATAEISPAPLRFHPKMSETYRERVAALIRGLGEANAMDKAREAVRGLIEKIVLTPAEGEDCGLAIDLHGALASLLRLAIGTAVCGAEPVQDAFKACEVNSQAIDIVSKSLLVAGAGFEHCLAKCRAK